MTREELATKFQDCSQWLLSAAAQEKVLDSIYMLDGLDSVSQLTTLLKG
jgi:hypothetical protein